MKLIPLLKQASRRVSTRQAKGPRHKRRHANELAATRR